MELFEFIKIGLLHNPSGRLLTSETFRGSLNVSGQSLKRRQVWTLFTEVQNPTAFLLQNHLGDFLGSDRDGKVFLVADKPGPNERFIIHFSMGEIAIQSEAHGLYLHWTGNEMRCFSKDPIWWGMRLAMHPQIHLRSVNRDCFIRSANEETELRAVTKMPYSRKFLLWLEQPPLPVGGNTGKERSRREIAYLSQVALRTESGRYLCSDGSLKRSLAEANMFSISFKPGPVQALAFQDPNGEFLSIGAAGSLKVKMVSPGPRREGLFSIESPTNHVHIWAFNNRFACNKQGLTFSENMEETEEHKSIVYQLEYMGGNIHTQKDATAIASNTAEADAAPLVRILDGPENNAAYLLTGLWRLRSEDGRLWQIPPTGVAELAPKNCKESTTFEIIYVPSYENESDPQEATGGIVLCTPEGRIVSAKTLGCIGATDRRLDTEWRPIANEVLHIITLVNRTSIACYSPLAGAFLTESSGRPGGVECLSPNAEKWFLRHLTSGAVQLYKTQSGRSWSVLSIRSKDEIGLEPSGSGPFDESPEILAPETQFVPCMVSDQHVLLRCILPLAGSTKLRPGFLSTNLQGVIQIDVSGTVTSACIWQI